MWRTEITVAGGLMVALVAFVAAERVNYNGAQLLRVSTPTPEVRDKLSLLEEQEDVEKWYLGEKEVDVFVQAEKVPQVKESLDKDQLEYRVLIDDVQDAIDKENPPLSEDELNLVGRKGHRMTWQYYHRLEDIHGYMDYLAQTYPNLVSVQTIGNSVEGRPLKVIKISSGEPNSKAVWIDGGTHAREWISPASVTYIINQLVENRDNYLDEVKGIDFHILPVLNPDGYEYSHTADRLWRKNRGRNYNGVCVGTDLNRNWGYKWGGAGSSKVPCKEIYAGAQAFSEPETAAISNYVLANKANMKGYLTFHSYGQYILYPWGYDRKVPPDYMDLARVGYAMGEAMRKQGGHQYTVGNSATTLYSAAGGADDWAKGQAGVKYAYTVELPDTGRYGFILPATYIQPVAKEAFAAVRVLAQEVKNTP
ncbi:carboxypeptidase B-like [Homalodisca vitripennis]|nr:carboxypeptidase B-like [Homalodisca vitripennis]